MYMMGWFDPDCHLSRKNNDRLKLGVADFQTKPCTNQTALAQLSEPRSEGSESRIT